jgi:putative ABC transport system permease protein
VLRPGITLQSANADVTRVIGSVARKYPEHFPHYARSPVLYATTVLVGPVATLLWMLYAAVFVLLIIACANVTNLSLVRAATREREFVVRSAIGATRSRLAWQLCTESAILVTVAGIAGVILAHEELRAFDAFGSTILPRWEDVQIDATMLAYTAGLVILVAVIIGLLPAFLCRRDLCTGLKDAGRSGDKAAGGRLRSALVVAEIALALAVAISAGLIVRSYVALTKVDVGFNPRNAYVLTVPNLPPARYPNDAAQALAVHRMEQNIRAIPGVTDVNVSAVVPFLGEFNVGTVVPSIPAFHDDIDGNAIVPGYFHALGIRLLRGRTFNQRDSAKSQPVAMVSEALARHVFGGVDKALGVQITPAVTDNNGVTPPRVIVGVVSNTRNSLSAPPDEELYLPLTQAGSPNLIFMRSDANQAGLGTAVARAVSRVDPLFAPPTLSRYTDLIADDAERSRATAALFGLLAIVAVILALAGVYSVTAFSAAQRTREMGIRKAVGATDKDVVWVVVSAALRQSIVGIAIGVILAASAAGVLSTLLFQTSALDPATFAAVCLLVIACSTGGALVPAVKATRVAPSTALHYE